MKLLYSTLPFSFFLTILGLVTLGFLVVGGGPKVGGGDLTSVRDERKFEEIFSGNLSINISGEYGKWDSLSSDGTQVQHERH